MEIYHQLRQLAEAATAGPWMSCKAVRGKERCTCGHVYTNDSPLGTVALIRLRATDRASEFHGSFCSDEQQLVANADYIAAANPAVMLALLDRIKALEDSTNG